MGNCSPAWTLTVKLKDFQLSLNLGAIWFTVSAITHQMKILNAGNPEY